MEVKGDSAAEEQLEPLLILEEGDDPEQFVTNTERGKGVLRLKTAEDDAGGDNVVTGQTEFESANVGVVVKEEIENQQESKEESPGATSEEKTGVTTVKAEIEAEKSGEVEPKKDLLAVPGMQAAKLRPRELLKPGDAQQKGHRLSPDFPDALYELLCTLQEGRRLNDQRCSFRLEGRRRCYSEPGTPRHSHKVVFSSMTSLQKEEFFDLLATSQARRLDDQRADFQSPPSAPSSPTPPDPPAAPAADLEPKAKARKGSCRPPEASHLIPKPPAKEELYNMILTSQAQGRLEEQRSVPPGPVDDEDFFSLLLKVQGGRMDEQRTELPIAFKY